MVCNGWRGYCGIIGEVRGIVTAVCGIIEGLGGIILRLSGTPALNGGMFGITR